MGTLGGPDGTNAAGFLLFRADGTWAYDKIANNATFSPQIFDDPRHFGTWETDGDLLVIYSDEGSFSCGGTTATYNLFSSNAADGALLFVSVDEPCRSRRSILQGAWLGR